MHPAGGLSGKSFHANMTGALTPYLTLRIGCLSFVAAARVPPVHRGKLAAALGHRLADVPSLSLSHCISVYHSKIED